ncbi:MAG: peptide deformylase [Phycisphaerales bacterium]
MPVDPATLRILHYPDEALRRRAAPVERVDDEVRGVAARMIDLMREAEGIGLAAPQVGLPWRLFVVEVPPGEDRDADTDPAGATLGPLVFINPRLGRLEGAPEPMDEGCLSLPEITGQVLRPPIVTATALDVAGNEFTVRAGGLFGRCVQHEHDHLDGVLIIDKMTQMSRMKNRSLVRHLERSVRG